MGDITVNKEEPAVKEDAKAVENKPGGIALPITEMTDDWMDDDVAIGAMDSDEDEEEKRKDTVKTSPQPLALTQPSYASIASHETPQSVLDKELPAPPEVVILKEASSKPLVINVEEKPVTEEEKVRDMEGFVEVSTKKIKKERRRSRKISQDEKEEETCEKEANIDEV